MEKEATLTPLFLWVQWLKTSTSAGICHELRLERLCLMAIMRNIHPIHPLFIWSGQRYWATKETKSILMGRLACQSGLNHWLHPIAKYAAPFLWDPVVKGRKRITHFLLCLPPCSVFSASISDLSRYLCQSEIMGNKRRRKYTKWASHPSETPSLIRKYQWIWLIPWGGPTL